MTKADFRSLWRIQASGTACAVNLASFLKAKAPKRKPISSRKIEKKQERLAKKEARAEVRAACVARADGHCEGCAMMFQRFNPGELDHLLGRAFSESVETCWYICRFCHQRKTENWPNRQLWDDRFAAFCKRHDYPFRKRLTKNLARRSRLGETSSDMGSAGGAIGGLPLSTESK